MNHLRMKSDGGMMVFYWDVTSKTEVLHSFPFTQISLECESSMDDTKQ